MVLIGIDPYPYIHQLFGNGLYQLFIKTMGISPAAEPLPDLVPRHHSGTGQHGIGRDQLQRVHLRSGSLGENSMGTWVFRSGWIHVNPQNLKWSTCHHHTLLCYSLVMTNIAMAMENGRVIAHLPIENAGFPSFFLCLRGYLKLGGSPHFTKWVITPVLYMGKVRLITQKTGVNEPTTTSRGYFATK